MLKPGGEAIFMVYNRISWLNGLSKVMKVALEHEDAPVLRKYTIGEFTALLAPFASVRIVPERFPVKSRLHRRLEGDGLQHAVRRDLQRTAAGAGPSAGLAPDGVLPEVAWRPAVPRVPRRR